MGYKDVSLTAGTPTRIAGFPSGVHNLEGYPVRIMASAGGVPADFGGGLHLLLHGILPEAAVADWFKDVDGATELWAFAEADGKVAVTNG